MLTWTHTEVAAQFGRTVDEFDHNRLIERHGFPRPLPGFRRPLIWSRAALAAWVASAGLRPSAAIAEAAAAISADDLIRSSAALDRHFGTGGNA